MVMRRLGAIALGGLLLATAGCGGSGSGGSGSASSGGGDVAKVGAILSLSGIYSTLGPPEQKAMNMGLEALNKQGFDVGGKKRTLQITYVDDKSDAATTGVTAFRQLTQSDNVRVIAFGLGSSTYAPLLKRTPLPMVNVLDSGYPSILQYDPHLFLMRGDSPTYVPGCLDYAAKQLNAKTVSVISASGEPYAEGLTQLVQKDAAAAGVTVAATATYPVGATDYGNAISAALAPHPDFVYLSSVTAVILPVLKQLRQSGYTGPVFHSSGVNPNQAQAILGDQFNSIMTDNYDCAGTLPTTSSNPPTQQFAKDYQSRYNEYPQDLTMWAYDFPFVIASAMSKAGSTTDREAIFKALPEISVPKGTISGWVPGPDGLLFTNRDARTISEVTTWCPDKKTLASAMVFDEKDGKVVNPQVRTNPCASVG
jgi:branched-chain amino acid transport system substrate-binding protein